MDFDHPIPVRLDYAFVPSRYEPRLRRCEVVTSDATKEASDHFPILVEI